MRIERKFKLLLSSLKYIFVLILLVASINTFAHSDEFDPKIIVVTGRLMDFRTNKPLSKTTLFLGREKMSDLYVEDATLIDQGKTNRKGIFTVETVVNLKKPEIWLNLEDAAQVRFRNIPDDKDTLNLMDIYIVYYDNELKEVKYHVPESKSTSPKLPKRTPWEIREVYTLFEDNETSYNMSLNPIDSTESISRLNFGPDQPRGTIIHNYKIMTFTRDLSKSENRGLTELPIYNQRLLFLKYGIDSILIRYAYEEDTVERKPNKFYVLNDSGYKVNMNQYCTAGNLFYSEIYDSVGRIVRKMDFDYDCGGKRTGETQTSYGVHGPVLKRQTYPEKRKDLMVKWGYDATGRVIRYEDHDGLGLNWIETTTYFDQKDSAETVRINYDGDTLFVLRKEYDTFGREIVQTAFYNGVVTSEYTTAYDEYGNVSRRYGYFFPAGEIRSDRYYFYSEPHKLNMTKTLSSADDGVYNYVHYKYDELGFLREEVVKDNRNGKKYSVHYEYR